MVINEGLTGIVYSTKHVGKNSKHFHNVFQDKIHVLTLINSDTSFLILSPSFKSWMSCFVRGKMLTAMCNSFCVVIILTLPVSAMTQHYAGIMTAVSRQHKCRELDVISNGFSML